MDDAGQSSMEYVGTIPETIGQMNKRIRREIQINLFKEVN